MSTDFVADQEVTAEDLANICVDLGATEYTDFSTLAPPLAVNELNKITMDLVSKGILLTLNRCQVTCDGDVITVAEGVCVFENGAKIRLTEPKTISKMASGATYVYFFNNVAESTAGLYAASEAPTEGDFVLLALVYTNGVVTDKRQYSSARYTEMSGARYVYDASQNIYFPPYYDEDVVDYDVCYSLQKTIEIPFEPTYVVMFHPYDETWSTENAGKGSYAVKIHDGTFMEKSLSFSTSLKLVKNGRKIEIYTYRWGKKVGGHSKYTQLIFV